MAAVSSGAGHQRLASVAQMPMRPPGEYSTKAMKISPNQSSQFGVQIENNSRNRMKNSAPSAGPSMLRMPPITTIASSSPEAVSVPFSGELLAMVVIGGMRSVLGPAPGALFFILFRELVSSG